MNLSVRRFNYVARAPACNIRIKAMVKLLPKFIQSLMRPPQDLSSGVSTRAPTTRRTDMTELYIAHWFHVFDSDHSLHHDRPEGQVHVRNSKVWMA